MKVKALLGMTILAVMMVACGGGASGPKATMEKFVVVTETMADSMEKADTAVAVVAAINSYSDSMEKLIPEMKAVNEKHPELKELGKGGEVPAEYKEIMERITKAGEKMGASMMKMGQFYQDEGVQKAQKRLMEVMEKMK